MLNISKRDIERAQQEARDALSKAFGPSQETPDGKYCWPGRINRAYTLLAKAQDDKTLKAVERLCVLGQQEMAWAEKKRFVYFNMCNTASFPPENIDIECDCSFCQNTPTIHG